MQLICVRTKAEYFLREGLDRLLVICPEDYALDTDRRELRRGAEMTPLAPQVFDLLDYLIRNRERVVVSKDDLIRAIWNGRSVSDAALTTRLNAVRGAIGDTGEKQHLDSRRCHAKASASLEPCKRKSSGVPGRTGRFGDAWWRGCRGDAISSGPRLSIVVLPFANLSAIPRKTISSMA